MKAFTLKQAAAAGGVYCGPEALADSAVRGVVIDNRGVREGFLFVPIRGERFDGHDFIDAAYGAGALCCVSEKKRDARRPYILVDSSLAAFQNIAAFYRGLFDVKMVGVTGSAGKTTTKEMIAAVLARRFCVLKSEGNLNNQTGVPLTLLRLEEEHDVAVVEMGTNRFGEIRALSRITRPDYCFLTNIGDAHIERLGSKKGILEAKCEMLEHMAEDGAVFLNGDDPLLQTVRSRGKKIVRFGFSEGNDVRAAEAKPRGLCGTDCVIRYPGGETTVFVPAPGRHMVQNALAAFAAGLAFGMDAREIAEGIAQYAPVGDRMRVEEKGGVTVLNDAYNANPEAVRAALDTLSLAPGRKVAVLGDMLELGENAAEYHRQIGLYAARKADLVLCAGPLSKHTRAGARPRAAWFETQEELIAALPAHIRVGDTVLVKASRGMALEKTANALLGRLPGETKHV